MQVTFQLLAPSQEAQKWESQANKNACAHTAACVASITLVLIGLGFVVFVCFGKDPL